jgi:hypothetical protein
LFQIERKSVDNLCFTTVCTQIKIC